MRTSWMLMPGIILLGACGSDSTGPDSARYQVSVSQTTVRTGDSGAYLRDITLHVSRTGDAAPGVRVAVQFTAGSVAPLPLLTNGSGDVELTWSIPAGQQASGSTHSLGFCGYENGSSCSVDMTGNEVVRVSF